MNKTRVRVLGHKGYLGSYLFQELSKDMNIELTQDDYNIDYLINCMGLVDVSACLHNPGKSLVSNCGEFIRVCDHTKPKNIINMSSYFVYDKNGSIFNTNYAMHKHLADQYTELKGGKVLVLGKLFGKSPNQQNRFPEACLQDEVYAEELVHPFTHISSVLAFVDSIIYRHVYERYCVDFNISPFEFAMYCGCKKVIEIPMLSPFEGYGDFVCGHGITPSSHDYTTYDKVRSIVSDYKKEMECTA
jgi:hypothetical protein